MKKSRKEIKSRREGKRGTQRKKKKLAKFTTIYEIPRDPCIVISFLL
jgi:hypothetical protein